MKTKEDNKEVNQDSNNIELYKASIELFKHFNFLVDRVRIIVVTSGIIVFGAVGKIYLNYEGEVNWKLIFLISLWGLCFITSMWMLGKHYLMHTESIARGGRQIEEKLEGNQNHSNAAFNRVHLDHNKWKQLLDSTDVEHLKKPLNEKVVKYFFDYGTFVVMWLGCLTVFIISIIMLITKI